LIEAGHEVLFVASGKSLSYLRKYFGEQVSEIFGLCLARRMLVLPTQAHLPIVFLLPYHLPAVFEPVADAANRLDVIPIGTELLSQIGDLNVHGPIRDDIVAAMKRIDDLIAAENNAGAARQHVQDVELGQGQGEGPILEQSFAATGVDCQIVDRDYAAIQTLLCFLAQRSARPGHQHFRAERLGDVIIGPEFQAGDDIALLALGGENDDGDGAGLEVRLENLADIQTLEPRKQKVQDNQRRLAGAGNRERLVAGPDRQDLVALPLEAELNQLLDIFFVIDN
jgi:hypothetical protein